MITMQGLPWCRDQPKRIGLSSATAKILCSAHNNALSDLDTAAGQWFETMRYAAQLKLDRRKEPPWRTPTVVRSRVDAGRLECWMLKTLINLMHGQPVKIRDADSPLGVPPSDLVAACFGQRPLAGRAGMYMAAAGGMVLHFEDGVRFFALLRDEGATVVGGGFQLHGLRFIFSLDEQELPSLRAFRGMLPGWQDANLMHRFANFTFKAGIWPSHVIDFDWSAALSRPPTAP